MIHIAESLNLDSAVVHVHLVNGWELSYNLLYPNLELYCLDYENSQEI